MSITDWSVKNRVVVIVAIIALTAGGLVSYLSLPLEAFPDIQIPFVMISTRYRGVAPLDVEKSITIKIEDELKGLADVRKVTSTSSEGNSTVVVEFEAGLDMDDALRKVKDRVDRAQGNLPRDLDGDPDVFEISSSDFPICQVVLSGPVGLPLLKEIAEKYKDDIEAIPQVLEAEISGGLEREIVVAVNNERAIGYNLPITQVNSQITAENTSVSGGTLRMGSGRYQLRVPGEFERPDEAERIVVAVIDNQPIYLDDVAEVKDGFKEQMSRSRIDYQSAVTIGIKKRTGGNVVELVDQVDAILEKRAPSLPGGVTTVKVQDMARFVRWLVSDLENNLISGFLLVLVVVLFAMGFRNALLVSISIPLSMLITFVVLDAMNVSLNMMVLFSMILSLGMLVDNAIVIIENIYRFMQQGVPRVTAACRATSEVAWPIIGSSATTIAAFMPLLFWPGMMGSVMKYIPITVIITLASCLVVALVINPALAAFFMKKPDNAKVLTAEEVEKAGEMPLEHDTGMTVFYKRMLEWCLRRRAPIIVGSAIMVFISFQVWQLAIGLRKPSQFMPSVDPDTVFVEVDPPEGASLEYNDAIVREVERRIRGEGGQGGDPSDLANLEHVLGRASIGGGGGFGPGNGSPNVVTMTFKEFEHRVRPGSQTLSDIRGRLKGIPGAGLSVVEEEKGPPAGPPINIEIAGDNLIELGRLAGVVGKATAKVPLLHDVRNDLASGVPTVRVRVDRKKAAMVGLNTQAVGMGLKAAFNGFEVSTYRELGDDYDIIVRLPDADRDTIDSLARFFMPTMTGDLVPLTTIADIVYEGGYSKISHVDFERAVTVRADLDENLKPASVAREEITQELLAAKDELMASPALASLGTIDLGSDDPEVLRAKLQEYGYDVRFTGQFEFEKESGAFLVKAGLLALFLISIIIVAIFNSIAQPLIIMTSVIMSVGGAFLGLAVAQLPFVLVMSGIGLISLFGVVVNNAIVLVDYTNKLRKRGMPLKEAVIAGGATRLRPVILTAITTILGLVPLVTGIAFDFRRFAFASASESQQWWTPMAICVIFGLGLATFLTLVVVPCLYHAIESAKLRVGPMGILKDKEDVVCS